jgi:hypothetical protein
MGEGGWGWPKFAYKLIVNLFNWPKVQNFRNFLQDLNEN